MAGEGEQPGPAPPRDPLQEQLAALGPAPAGMDLGDLRAGLPPDQPPVATVPPQVLATPGAEPERRTGGRAPGGLMFGAKVPAMVLLLAEAFWAAHPERALGMSDEGRLTFYISLACFQHALAQPVDAEGNPLYRHEFLVLDALEQQIQAEVDARRAESNAAAAEVERDAILAEIADIAPAPVIARIKERKRSAQ